MPTASLCDAGSRIFCFPACGGSSNLAAADRFFWDCSDMMSIAWNIACAASRQWARGIRGVAAGLSCYLNPFHILTDQTIEAGRWFFPGQLTYTQAGPCFRRARACCMRRLSTATNKAHCRSTRPHAVSLFRAREFLGGNRGFSNPIRFS